MLLLRNLKSYLPAHSILRGFVALHLCDFADAIHAGCAEAKLPFCARMNMDYDAIRAGCAEAKPCLHSLPRLISVMQSVRDVPKRTEGHCIQTIMRRTMK